MPLNYIHVTSVSIDINEASWMHTNNSILYICMRMVMCIHTDNIWWYCCWYHVRWFKTNTPCDGMPWEFCGLWLCHNDVIKWKHFLRYWPFVRGIHRSPVNSPHKGQWRGALMFSLICVWINGWVNNREAGDLRRYRAHYDVIVMRIFARKPGTVDYIVDMSRWI